MHSTITLEGLELFQQSEEQIYLSQLAELDETEPEVSLDEGTDNFIEEEVLILDSGTLLQRFSSFTKEIGLKRALNFIPSVFEDTPVTNIESEATKSELMTQKAYIKGMSGIRVAKNEKGWYEPSAFDTEAANTARTVLAHADAFNKAIDELVYIDTEFLQENLSVEPIFRNRDGQRLKRNSRLNVMFVVAGYTISKTEWYRKQNVQAPFALFDVYCDGKLVAQWQKLTLDNFSNTANFSIGECFTGSIRFGLEGAWPVRNVKKVGNVLSPTVIDRQQIIKKMIDLGVATPAKQIHNNRGEYTNSATKTFTQWGLPTSAYRMSTKTDKIFTGNPIGKHDVFINFGEWGLSDFGRLNVQRVHAIAFDIDFKDTHFQSWFEDISIPTTTDSNSNTLQRFYLDASEETFEGVATPVKQIHNNWGVYTNTQSEARTLRAKTFLKHLKNVLPEKFYNACNFQSSGNGIHVIIMVSEEYQTDLELLKSFKLALSRWSKFEEIGFDIHSVPLTQDVRALGSINSKYNYQVTKLEEATTEIDFFEALQWLRTQPRKKMRVAGSIKTGLINNSRRKTLYIRCLNLATQFEVYPEYFEEAMSAGEEIAEKFPGTHPFPESEWREVLEEAWKAVQEGKVSQNYRRNGRAFAFATDEIVSEMKKNLKRKLGKLDFKVRKDNKILPALLADLINEFDYLGVEFSYSQKFAALRLGTDQARITEMLDKLSKHGYIVCVDETFRPNVRAKVWRLTEKFFEWLLGEVPANLQGRLQIPEQVKIKADPTLVSPFVKLSYSGLG